MKFFSYQQCFPQCPQHTCLAAVGFVRVPLDAVLHKCSAADSNLAYFQSHAGLLIPVENKHVREMSLAHASRATLLWLVEFPNCLIL